MPRPAPARPLACYAVTAPGLESLAAGELRPLLPMAPMPEPGGVAFEGTREDLYRANLWLRTASRVLVRLADFHAAHFSELQHACAGIAWERVVPPGRAVRLRVTCRKSRLYHSDAVAERVADAIHARTGAVVSTRGGGRGDDGGPGGEEPDVGDADDAQLLVVRLLHDHCTVSADSSGALLHRRGYRQALAKAPLRETLAAGLLLAAGYDGGGPLLDPLCGSGTIAIEGALIARRIAPGRHRAFAFEQWPDFDAGAWRALRTRADEHVLPFAPHPITASDRDAGAVRAAASNAERAGVAEDVTVEQRALSAAEPAGPAGADTPGWLVTNPPYGKRLGEQAPLRDLYARLGQFARIRCPGWRVALLAPDPRLAGQLALPLTEALRTTNGGLPVHLLAGIAPGGPRASAG